MIGLLIISVLLGIAILVFSIFIAKFLIAIGDQIQELRNQIQEQRAEYGDMNNAIKEHVRKLTSHGLPGLTDVP